MERGLVSYLSLPAIRGIQAGREYYTTMVPLRLVPKLFTFNDTQLEPELRSQRTLNKARVPAIARYVTGNPTEYVFSSVTASIDADIVFQPISQEPGLYNVGAIRIPLGVPFVINDGQHRSAAIDLILKEHPELGDESISCVLFQDRGLSRAQQMFTDLNRHAVRPSQSINVLYDQRDKIARVAKHLVHEVSMFRDSTELERSTISNRSRNLFTLSSIHRATSELLKGVQLCDDDFSGLATRYWTELSKHIEPWREAKVGRLRPDVLRRDFIVGHAVALVAFGRSGRGLIDYDPDNWANRLRSFESVDWRRSNTVQWEGRVTNAGRMSIAGSHIALLSNELKRLLQVPLTSDEVDLEEAWMNGAAVERSSK